jgi:hypothetical protein
MQGEQAPMFSDVTVRKFFFTLGVDGNPVRSYDEFSRAEWALNYCTVHAHDLNPKDH